MSVGSKASVKDQDRNKNGLCREKREEKEMKWKVQMQAAITQEGRMSLKVLGLADNKFLSFVNPVLKSLHADSIIVWKMCRNKAD